MNAYASPAVTLWYAITFHLFLCVPVKGAGLQELDVLKPDQHPAAYQYLQEMKARTGYQKAVVH